MMVIMNFTLDIVRMGIINTRRNWKIHNMNIELQEKIRSEESIANG